MVQLTSEAINSSLFAVMFGVFVRDGIHSDADYNLTLIGVVVVVVVVVVVYLFHNGIT